MKTLKVITVLCIYIFSLCGFSTEIQSSESNVYGTYKKNNLTIISYSENWPANKLNSVYNELIKNFHGKELDYLSAIYLFPDSPDGNRGNYYEDITYYTDGTFKLGTNAYIELYNMLDVTDVRDIAYVLAHEYGHHYTLYNITKYEEKIYMNWDDSEYSLIRQLYDYPVYYNKKLINGEDEGEYQYLWDVTEIAANDYMQFLSSENARSSYDYKDVKDALDMNIINYSAPCYFNAKPQENMNIPLATDVSGLYEYLLKISGRYGGFAKISERPEIISIEAEESYNHHNKYTLMFSKLKGQWEYTVIMRPISSPYFYPIKTVSAYQTPVAVFGTVARYEKDGKISYIINSYEGEYEFRVLAKSKSGYVFSSDPVFYNSNSSKIVSRKSDDINL